MRGAHVCRVAALAVAALGSVFLCAKHEARGGPRGRTWRTRSRSRQARLTCTSVMLWLAWLLWWTVAAANAHLR